MNPIENENHYQAIIGDLLVQKKSIEDQIAHAAIANLNRNCPVKVGDVVQCNCFTHKGKFIYVTHVDYDKQNPTLFVAKGDVLTKDGRRGRYWASWESGFGDPVFGDKLRDTTEPY